MFYSLQIEIFLVVLLISSVEILASTGIVTGNNGKNCDDNENFYSLIQLRDNWQSVWSRKTNRKKCKNFNSHSPVISREKNEEERWESELKKIIKKKYQTN